ncbi:Acetyl-CoA:oxalate CoA-transferase [Brevundimonas sp. NIBR10]|uniref:CaiB/BaiF CoA transferase family protein n=1 Tax=Brevundimonas sp. NIBR10 TaxID=3015997 RepID=UPI0022F15D23|nr:CaiB/BaiF CoA-transferase family protein [Brevundimonas sp. NIBR10]WGM45992.1 Acetyl-CoA:oxalate CoA-transferase [Brevundimonas sp. NIBR10]
MTLPPGPLAGVRIVEFDAIGPVPLAAMLLADLGAEIVRIARAPNSGQAWDDTGGAVLNRNRKHVHLDLKVPADRDRALSLVARADAVIEGFRPGVMERLGLGPDACLTVNPRLAFVRMTGWGQTGPLAERAGHDLNYIAVTGVLEAMGSPDRPPPVPLNLVGDYGGGSMFAVMGLLAAIISARASGRGQVVDVAMTDGVAALSSLFHGLAASGLWMNARGLNLLDGSKPFYRCYACADGRSVAVGALEPAFFGRLLAGLDLDPAAFNQFDPSGWPAMAETFAGVFATRTRDEWAARFEGTDACVSPVLDFAEAADHPHNAARQTLIEVDGVRQPAPAPRFSDTPAAIDPARRGLIDIDHALAAWSDQAMPAPPVTP